MVRLGNATDANNLVVLSGVSVGDRLVDQPPPGLRAGTQVTAPAQPDNVQNAQ